jgi:hypothetical protein
MKISQLSNYGDVKDPEKILDYLRVIDRDLSNIFLVIQGRVRFGSATTNTVAGAIGENIAGEFRIFNATTTTVSASATTEFTTSHRLGAIPVGFIMINKTKAGDLYMPSASATSATFISSTTATQYTVFLLK